MSLLDLNHANLTQTLLSRLFQSDIRTWLLDYAQPYKELMAYYRCAMMEVSTKFQVLNEEFSLQYDRNPIEGIKTRLKSLESVIEKLSRKQLPLSIESIEQNINDIAGVRVVCSYQSDIYMLADAFLHQDDIVLIQRKDYILLFFVSAVLGWIMEVTCKLFEFHRFINRGFLIGPYCPIYGVGAVVITATLTRYADSPVIVFIMAILICGTLEYLTSYAMEKLFHARWWDYSQRRWNINGRICAVTLIPFGILGLVMIYLVKPFLFRLFAQIPQPWMDGVCAVLVAVFLTDTVISTTILGKIRHTAELASGDSTEAITHIVREKLQARPLVRRTLRAFPYAQVYNRRLLERIKRTRAEIKEELQQKREGLRSDVEQWEQRMRILKEKKTGK